MLVSESTRKVDDMLLEGVRGGLKAGHVAWKEWQGREKLKQLTLLTMPLVSTVQGFTGYILGNVA